MTWFHPEWLERRRQRFTRADAYRWLKPHQVDDSAPSYLRKYRADAAGVSKEAPGISSTELQDARCALASAAAGMGAVEVRVERAKGRIYPAQPRDEEGRWTVGPFGGEPLQMVVADAANSTATPAGSPRAHCDLQESRGLGCTEGSINPRAHRQDIMALSGDSDYLTDPNAGRAAGGFERKGRI